MELKDILNTKNISNSFQVFLDEAPGQSKAWMEIVKKLDEESTLDLKTEQLAYIAVLAAVGLESGIPFLVKQTKQLGTTRDEIKSAVLVGLPAVGNRVIASLPIALHAYDEVS